MKTKIIEIADSNQKSELCRRVLADLSEWFGQPESNRCYCEQVKQFRFLAIVHENSEIGFASLKQNTPNVVELYVLGIFQKYHHRGFGKLLMNYIVNDLKGKGIQYLEVKTLAESAESLAYQKTRSFYLNEGFIPLDVLYNEWGEENPCLIMIKKL